MGNRQRGRPNPEYTQNLSGFRVRSWPHLVGWPVREAVESIQRDDSSLQVIKIPQGAPVTYDMNYGRVHVVYNRYGYVSSVPVIG